MEKLEIYDEDTLNEFELKRQNNIIRNYEFFKLCGKNVHYLVLLPCLLVPGASSRQEEGKIRRIKGGGGLPTSS